MNITKHALQRWEERVGKDEQVMKDMLEKATYIWTGEKSSHFYLCEDVMFVIKNKNVVTVFTVDFGFGKEINNNIIQGLLAEIDRLQVEIEEIETSPDLIKLDIELDEVDAKIKHLNNKIAMLQSVRNKVSMEKNAILKEKENLEDEHESACKKLCYSLSWRIENLGKKVG